jgi:hypothetical protein
MRIGTIYCEFATAVRELGKTSTHNEKAPAGSATYSILETFAHSALLSHVLIAILSLLPYWRSNILIVELTFQPFKT